MEAILRVRCVERCNRRVGDDLTIQVVPPAHDFPSTAEVRASLIQPEGREMRPLIVPGNEECETQRRNRQDQPTDCSCNCEAHVLPHPILALPGVALAPDSVVAAHAGVEVRKGGAAV
eukprot:3428529-Rhodomonas_salina.2